MTERSEVTFEVEETVIVRGESSVLWAFCLRCDAESQMASPPTASAMSGLTEREIFRLVEAGQIHFSENGRLLVCVTSLQDSCKTILATVESSEE